MASVLLSFETVILALWVNFIISSFVQKLLTFHFKIFMNVCENLAECCLWNCHLWIITVAAVRRGRQRLRRGAADGARGGGWRRHGRGGRGRAAAENQVVPPKTNVGVTAVQTVDLLCIDGATAGGYSVKTRDKFYVEGQHKMQL